MRLLLFLLPLLLPVVPSLLQSRVSISAHEDPSEPRPSFAPPRGLRFPRVVLCTAGLQPVSNPLDAARRPPFRGDGPHASNWGETIFPGSGLATRSAGPPRCGTRVGILRGGAIQDIFDRVMESDEEPEGDVGVDGMDLLRQYWALPPRIEHHIPRTDCA